MSGVSLWRCENCRRGSFPRRELCPHCGSRMLAAERVERGVATEVTSHRGVGIACVQVGEDVILLARAGRQVTVGCEVALDVVDGAPVAALR